MRHSELGAYWSSCSRLVPVSHRSAWVLDSVIKSAVAVLTAVVTTAALEAIGIMHLLKLFIVP